MLDAGDATFGASLRSIRTERGLSQDALAEVLDTTTKQVGRWERGEQEPRLETLRRISAAMAVPVGRLLEGDGDAKVG